MSGWKAKRFWKQACAKEVEGGFTVLLDGRAVKTPAKAAFILPTLAVAQACAAEWDAQVGIVKPDLMPMTRYGNSAIDKVSHQHDEVVAIVAAYGATDLLCYRATGPEALIARQAKAWGPHLEWAASKLSAPLVVTQGVIPVDQPPESLQRLHELTSAMTPFQLAAFHDLVAITGSLILGLCMSMGRLSADEAFSISRVDEQWQAELWGKDDAAAELETLKATALTEASRFFALCA